MESIGDSGTDNKKMKRSAIAMESAKKLCPKRFPALQSRFSMRARRPSSNMCWTRPSKPSSTASASGCASPWKCIPRRRRALKPFRAPTGGRHSRNRTGSAVKRRCPLRKYVYADRRTQISKRGQASADRQMRTDGSHRVRLSFGRRVLRRTKKEAPRLRSLW